VYEKKLFAIKRNDNIVQIIVSQRLSVAGCEVAKIRGAIIIIIIIILLFPYCHRLSDRTQKTVLHLTDVGNAQGLSHSRVAKAVRNTRWNHKRRSERRGPINL